MCMTLILAPDISTPLRARHYCVSYSGTRSRTEVLVLWVLGTSVSCVAVSSVPMHNVQHQQQKKLQRSSTSSSSRSTSCDVIIEHLDVIIEQVDVDGGLWQATAQSHDVCGVVVKQWRRSRCWTQCRRADTTSVVTCVYSVITQPPVVMTPLVATVL